MTEDILGGDDAGDADFINEESESKYLTLSWWLLNVGWKDVGERVRRGVEEVFYGYVAFLLYITHINSYLLLQRFSED